MIPISSINHSQISDSRLQFDSVQRTRVFEDTQNSISANIQQTQAVPTENDLINRLPQDQVHEVTDIFQSINILANQALELGQDFENREDLQTEVEEDISELRSVLDELTQDDLTLFIAIFQNQIPVGLIDSGSASNDSVSDLSFNEISDNSLESLLSIDILSELGALTTLDLTGSIIDTLTRNNNSSILESLLDDLTNSLISATISESPAQDQESEETTTPSDSETSQDIDTAEPIIPIPPINPPDSNPPTIIDFVG